MTDLVKRLRNVTEDDAYAHPWTFGVTCKEAADRIEQLEAEVARLRQHAQAGWAQYQHWSDRYAERANAHDADIARLSAMTANAQALAKLVDKLWLHDDPPQCLAAHEKLIGR